MRDNAQQAARVEALQPMITERITTLVDAIEARRQGDFAAAQQVVNTGRGKIAMDNMRQLVRDMRIQEEELLDERVAQALAAANNSKLTIFLGTLSALLVAAITGALITQHCAAARRTDEHGRAHHDRRSER